MKENTNRNSLAAPELFLTLVDLLGAGLQQLLGQGHRVVRVDMQPHVRRGHRALVHVVAQLLEVGRDAVDVEGEVHHFSVVSGETEVLLGLRRLAHEVDEFVGVLHHQVHDDASAGRGVLMFSRVR